MMQTDVKSLAMVADDSVDGPVRLKSVLISYEAAGSVELTDGDGGVTVFAFTAPSTTDGSVNALIPGEGVRCVTGLYAKTVTDATITVFYG